MKVGDYVKVERPYIPQRDKYREWTIEFAPVQGIIEYISDRWATVTMISNKDHKKLYKESFYLNEIHPIKESN